MSKRGCLKADGKPKRAYSSFDEALAEASRHVGVAPYQCKQHGWHVGHTVSRALRSALRGRYHHGS